MALSSGGAHVSDLRDEPMKYVYLDIVGFSRERPSEIQAEIIRSLNDIVQEAVESVAAFAFAQEAIILLPTGDGMCIALTDITNPYDIHIQLALAILRLVDSRNAELEDSRRQFKVRIGVHEEIDITYTDINNKRNVAGAGINLAQRIMDAGDGGNLLLSVRVYSTLINRERYSQDDFRSFPRTIKHGARITIHQLIQRGNVGLDLHVPSSEMQRQIDQKQQREREAVNRDLMLVQELNEVMKQELATLKQQGTHRKRSRIRAIPNSGFMPRLQEEARFTLVSIALVMAFFLLLVVILTWIVGQLR
jgi:class 3 adenylate cyclase